MVTSQQSLWDMRTWLDICSLCLCSRLRDIHQWMNRHNTATIHSWTSNKPTGNFCDFVCCDGQLCYLWILCVPQPWICKHQAMEMYQGITSLAERCSRSLKGLRSVGEGGASIAGQRGMKGEPDDVGRICLPFEYELDFKDGGFANQRWANGALTSWAFIAKKRRSTIN